jgi:hypothetical protein
MEDYVKRGKRGIVDGKWIDFVVILFASSYRISGLPLPEGVKAMTFEDAAAQLRILNGEDARYRYRANFLERASLPYIPSIDDEGVLSRASWWMEVDKMVKTNLEDFSSLIAKIFRI